MDFVQNIFNKLFGKDRNLSEPFVSGMLERDALFAEAYAKWKSAESAQDLSLIAEAYTEVKIKDKHNSALYIYESPQANGFYFNSQLGLDGNAFDFILDFFMEIVLQNGYQMYTSDRSYSEKPAGMQRLDRHYLKPEYTKDLHVPIDQKYGNIHLELIALDEVPQYLKVMAYVYSDRNYQKAQTFEGLMEKLLKAN